MAPVINEFSGRRNVKLTVVHSGQHYDMEMSESFFQEFDLSAPDFNLKIGSGSHARQTGQMLEGYENLIERHRPDIVLAEGDTNTVLAAGLASVKLNTCFGHVEAGLRCYDRTMPEEINRTIADACAHLCFAPTKRSAENLLREGIAPKKIHVTGNTIVEVCLAQTKKAHKRPSILESLAPDNEKPLVLVTTHRSENVDNPRNLHNIISALLRLQDCQVIFPVHPRTRNKLRKFNLLRALQRSTHIKVTKPLGYWDFLLLLEASKIVLTDSGGVQEEALTLRVPCLTLRYNTERPETIEAGGNILVGTDVPVIVNASRKLLQDEMLRSKLRNNKNPLGDGRASHRIAAICAGERESSLRLEPTSYMPDGSASYRLLGVRKPRKILDLRKEYPMITIELIYDSQGYPVVPEDTTYLKKGWQVQIFGQLSDITRFSQYLT